MCGGDVEIYQLYLNDVSPMLINGSNYADMVFQVNWDALFRSNNDKYKTCRVRCALTTDRVAAYAIGLTTGMLIMRGPTSNFNLGSGIDGAVFLTTLAPSPSTNSGDTTTGYIYDRSTLNSIHGTQMNMPHGTQQIRIQWLDDEAQGPMAASYVPSSWGLLLQFELSNPIV